MSDLSHTIWREFAHETDEHLQTIAAALSARREEREESVDQLFRSFHSLKGLSRVVGLEAMEATAHSAENALGLVRDGKLSLDEEIASLLLHASDVLAAMREHAIATGADGGLPADLIRTLAMVCDRVAAKEGGTTGASSARGVAADAGAGLHNDAELLSYYAENVRELLPDLARMLAPEFDTHRLRVEQALEVLRHGAAVLELEGLVASFDEIASLIPAEGDGAPSLDAAVAALARLRENALVLGELLGEDVGDAVFMAHVSDALGQGFDGIAAQAVAALRALDGSAGAATVAVPELSRVQDHLRLAGREAAADLVAFLGDIVSRVAHGHMAPRPAIFAALVEAAGLLSGEPDAKEVAREREKVQAVLADSGGERRFESLDAVRSLRIPGELAGNLQPEHIEDLAAALANGELVYTILAFPERNRDIGNLFISWLNAECTPVTNRSILIQGESAFEFLLHSRQGPSAVAEALREFDPQCRCVQWAAHITSEGEQRIYPEAPKGALAARGNEQYLRISAAIAQDLVDLLGRMLTEVTGLGRLVHSGQQNAALAALEKLASRLDDPEIADAFSSHIETLRDQRRQMALFSEAITLSMRRLESTALELRVVPIEPVFIRLGRSVRELAAGHGKNIQFAAQGNAVRIDKTIVEKLGDPLLHMVRNSIDHGVETPEERRAAGKPERAEIWVRAAQRGTEVLIEVGDNGRGLDVARIKSTAIRRGLLTEREAGEMTDIDAMRLIFRPGFSTAKVVTELSGRGVGMDVVLHTLQGLGGHIDIYSYPKEGTVFSLRFPQSAALQAVVVVEADGQVFGIPDRYVEELRQMQEDDIRRSAAGDRFLLRGESLPLDSLSSLFGRGRREFAPGQPVVVLAGASGRAVLAVDRLQGRQDIYFKELHRRLAAIPGVGGAAVQADGSVMLVIDGEGLIKLGRRTFPAADGGVNAAVS